ncbi:MAG: hypothetical protein HQL31_09335, partial [Planctomycetes bacterium]|nr:hypothetical protein [Planctomycetota bacterium]
MRNYHDKTIPPMHITSCVVLYLFLLISGCTTGSEADPAVEATPDAVVAVTTSTTDVTGEGDPAATSSEATDSGLTSTSNSLANSTYDESPEFLGNPFIAYYANDPFARNVWDMQRYEDHIYFGSGNSANSGPSQNMGPVSLITYDGVSFSKEFEVDEEQIALFRVLDGILYLPGHDATQSWSYGNLYRKVSGEDWEMMRTIPDALHVLDIALYREKIYCAIGAEDDGKVGVSGDGGYNWEMQSLGSGRVYNLLPIDDRLYAVKKLPRNYSDYVSVSLLDSESGLFK